jgi:hypothetical protein
MDSNNSFGGMDTEEWDKTFAYIRGDSKPDAEDESALEGYITSKNIYHYYDQEHLMYLIRLACSDSIKLTLAQENKLKEWRAKLPMYSIVYLAEYLQQKPKALFQPKDRKIFETCLGLIFKNDLKDKWTMVTFSRYDPGTTTRNSESLHLEYIHKERLSKSMNYIKSKNFLDPDTLNSINVRIGICLFIDSGEITNSLFVYLISQSKDDIFDGLVDLLSKNTEKKRLSRLKTSKNCMYTLLLVTLCQYYKTQHYVKKNSEQLSDLKSVLDVIDKENSEHKEEIVSIVDHVNNWELTRDYKVSIAQLEPTQRPKLSDLKSVLDVIIKKGLIDQLYTLLFLLDSLLNKQWNKEFNEEERKAAVEVVELLKKKIWWGTGEAIKDLLERLEKDVKPPTWVYMYI